MIFHFLSLERGKEERGKSFSLISVLLQGGKEGKKRTNL